MKTEKILVFVILLLISIKISYGQENSSYITMIQKIDSITKSKNIESGIVKILYVTNVFDKTSTNIKNLTKKRKFYFDDQFLVIENMYFNINKLLYFKIKNRNIEFFFQGY